MNYRIYATGKKGLEYLTTLYDEVEAEEYANELSYTDYSHVIIISHNIEKNMDDIYLSKDIDRPMARTRHYE